MKWNAGLSPCWSEDDVGLGGPDRFRTHLQKMSYEGESRRSRSRSPRRDGGGGGGGPPPPSGGGGGGFGGGGGGEASKLYVGNLSFQCQSEDLREYFSSVCCVSMIYLAVLWWFALHNSCGVLPTLLTRI